MKYLIDVPNDKVDAFLTLMEGLRKLDVVQNMQSVEPGKGESQSDQVDAGKKEKGEKSTHDFMEQYRDLVD